MAKLKSRTQGIPYGFQFHQAQTNWDAPLNASFDRVVRALIEHRLGNPFITKQNNLSTDYDAVAIEVDEFNAARMAANPRWQHFIEDGGGGGAGFWKPQRLQRSAAAVVASVKKTAAGVGVLRDWLGDGLRPVQLSLAEARGARCIECPQNGEPNWLESVSAHIADEVKVKMEIRNDLKLATSHDDALNVCKVCTCSLPLKVWTPIKHIAKETLPEVLKELAVVRTKSGNMCWVTEEITVQK